ncbi:MAG: glycoside hydrolase family 16 protein [Salinivirgaceae bacterium]|nr:glycoside hydrolase family 16 protein [Salinivirgaceae bacterium]
MKSSTLFKLFLLIIGLNIFQIQFLYAQSCYELVWSDEFNVPGLPDSDKWSYDVGGGGWGNNELQYYTSERTENARIEDSVLIIEARKEAYSGKQYTSARLITHYNGHAWKYGKIEAKI